MVTVTMILCTTGVTALAYYVAGPAWKDVTDYPGNRALVDLGYKIAARVVLGILFGRLLTYLIFNFSENNKHININDGFIPVAVVLTIFGLVELVHGYGFVAVFVAAIAFRSSELDHEFHKELHSFSDQTESILVAIVLLIFGGSLVHGILDHLSWKMAILSVVFLFLIHPISDLPELIGTKLHFKEKVGISFYGIRGIGSFYYLALKQHSFSVGRDLWSTVAFISLLSVIIHRLTATRAMSKLEERFSETV